jgi:hypothetical protein
LPLPLPLACRACMLAACVRMVRTIMVKL